MIQNECGVAYLVSRQSHVHGSEVSGWKFLVGPSEYNSLVLNEVQEIARVTLVAERKGPTFMGLD